MGWSIGYDSNWFAALGFGSALILLYLLSVLERVAKEVIALATQSADQCKQLQNIVENQRKLIQKMLDATKNQVG